MRLRGEVFVCRGKHGFASYLDAKTSLKLILRRVKIRREERYEIYRCVHCQCWHLGARLIRGGW